MRDVISITRALADPTRVRTVLALNGRELCVCQITELFGLAPSTVSKHLSILYQAGLVQARKEGRWIYYSLSDQGEPVVHQALAWIREALAGDPRVVDDAQHLERVLSCDPAELCKRQTRK